MVLLGQSAIPISKSPPTVSKSWAASGTMVAARPTSAILIKDEATAIFSQKNPDHFPKE
jgi:hypothetical protein